MTRTGPEQLQHARHAGERPAEIPDIGRLIQLVLTGAEPLVRNATQSRRRLRRTTSEPMSSRVALVSDRMLGARSSSAEWFRFLSIEIDPLLRRFAADRGGSNPGLAAGLQHYLKEDTTALTELPGRGLSARMLL